MEFEQNYLKHRTLLLALKLDNNILEDQDVKVFKKFAKAELDKLKNSGIKMMDIIDGLYNIFLESQLELFFPMIYILQYHGINIKKSNILEYSSTLDVLRLSFYHYAETKDQVYLALIKKLIKDLKERLINE